MKNGTVTKNRKINIIGFSGEKAKGELVIHPLFQECLVVPGAPRNLLSLSQLKDNHWKISYHDKNDVFCLKKNNLRMKFERDGKLYTCNNEETFSLDIEASQAKINRAIQARRLHSICGHPSDKSLKKMIREKMIRNTKVEPGDIDLAANILGQCADCIIGKGTKYPANKSSESRSNLIGEVIHIDIFNYGPKNLKESYLLGIDECSGFVTVNLLKNHSTEEVLEGIKQIISFYTSYGHKVKRISSDRELSVSANKMEINMLGCVLELTSAEGHERHAERSIRNIKGKCRSIRSSINFPFPRSFNRYLVKYSQQCINITPASGRKLSPWMMVTGKSINARRLLRCGFGEILLFGSTYLSTEKSNLPRAEFGLVLGIDMESKGTKLVYLIDKKQIVHRNHFWRVQLPDKIKSLLKDFQDLNPKPILIENKISPKYTVSTNEEGPISNEIQEPDIIQEQEQELDNEIPMVSDNLPISQPRRNPSRRNRSVIDYKLLNDPGLIKQHNNHESDTENVFFSIKEGRKIDENLTNEAVDSEIRQLLDQNVFEGIHYEDIGNESILPSRFLVDRKGNRFKGRLVAGGHKQNRNEYQLWETSSPTISVQGILCMVSIAVNTNAILSSVDVKGAYLFAPLKKLVVMKLPVEVSERLIEIDPSYSRYADHSGVVRVKLKKALYGLIESGNLWYHHITEAIKELGFQQIHSDQCIFKRKNQLIGVYVDDLLLLTANEEEKEDLVKEIESKYPELKKSQDKNFTYRGLEIEQYKDKIIISQRNYIKQLLQDNNIIKKSKTPARRNLFDKREEVKLLSKFDQEKYHENLAKIMWISNQTRPELRVATSVLAGRVQNPNIDDQLKLTRLLQYLNETKELGLTFRKGSTKIKAYADAAHLVHPDCRGHSGAVIQMGNNSIHCESKKQRVVSQSSTEAELIALNSCLNSVLWIRNMLEELGFKQNKTKIYQDNISCITIAHNGRPTKGTKHIKMRYFHIKEKMNDGTVKLKHKSTNKMIADILTKPVELIPAFNRLRNKIIGN